MQFFVIMLLYDYATWREIQESLESHWHCKSSDEYDFSSDYNNISYVIYDYNTIN